MMLFEKCLLRFIRSGAWTVDGFLIESHVHSDRHTKISCAFYLLCRNMFDRVRVFSESSSQVAETPFHGGNIQ